MSTTYYALRHPVAKVNDCLGYRFDLYNDVGTCMGWLHADTLHLAADRDVKVAQRSGASVVVTHPGPDDQQAISEYGELVTLGALRRGDVP